MIVRRFLQWATTASAEARAQGIAALARAYADDEFDGTDRRDAEAALTAMLDDPAPVVRLAMALELADSVRCPAAIATALTADRSDIAAAMLEFSPVLGTAELVDAVAVGDEAAQCAVARRTSLDVALAAALAEVAGAAACVELCRNGRAAISESAMFRLLERFGHLGEVRTAIEERGGLSPGLRFELVRETARSLASFVAAQNWLAPDRAVRTAAEATEAACVIIAGEARTSAGQMGLMHLVRHLRGTGQLTPALLLRAILCGNVALFETAVSELSGVPLARASGLVHAPGGLGFRSLYAQAGLPEALRPAITAALSGAGDLLAGETAGLQRGRIGRVLAACLRPGAGDVGSLPALLRRLDAQAAREEARTYARDVLAEAPVLLLPRLTGADRAVPLPSAA